MTTKRARRALVIGASISGLLAARALADYFEEVTVLERDRLPRDVQPRKGVPQDRHAHALLKSGMERLEVFFPGIRQNLAERGASQNDMLATGRWFFGGGYHVQFDSGLVGSVQSRPLLETVIRQRLLALANVNLQESVSVANLLIHSVHQRVMGVRLHNKENSEITALEADLVVDASGRGSRTPAWLEMLGYDRPIEELVKINLAYATRVYNREPGDLDKDTGLVIGAEPPMKRGGVVIPLEGERWIVTLAGTLGDHPPTDPEGFLEYSKTFARPDVYDLIRKAEPVSDISLYKFPANLRRRYERLARFPEGYLVVGDALCSFNPVYGQGMTVAALEAAALSACLKQGAHQLARRFFKRAAAIIDAPWQIAVGGDLRHPEVKGKRTALTRFSNWYLTKVQKAAHRDPTVCLAFHQVTNLIRPPSSLFRPITVWRVFRHNARKPLKGEPGSRTVTGSK